MLDDLDLNAILAEKARELIRRLLNLIEHLTGDLRDARAEIQRLRDEVNRLKGEQGKPNIKGNTHKPPSDHSSEAERKQPHTKSHKKATIQIDRTEVVEIDKRILLADAEFKGYEEVVVQDIELKTDNVLFRKDTTRHRHTRPACPSCRQATKGNLGLGSRHWCCRCTMAQIRVSQRSSNS